MSLLSPLSRWGWGAIAAGGLLAGGLAMASPAAAADSVTVRLGRLSQTVSLDDLQAFAATGEVPPSLRLYRPLLNASLQEVLQGEIALEPEVGQVILDEILQTPGGARLLDTLRAIAPNLAAADLRVTLEQVSEAEAGLTLLGILRAMPQDTLEIDVGTLLTLASQFRLAQMESKALGRVLREDPMTEAAEPAPLLGTDPFSTGSSKVERWELVLRDHSRDRSIPLDIYWSKDSHGPLVVISHGFGADRRFFAYLAKHLASHGLTVVSVEHPGSNVAALLSLPTDNLPEAAAQSRILPATEFLDRPRDISYVLDRLEKLNTYSYSLRDRINTDEVAFIGHSLGGYTGLALAGAALDLRSLEAYCQTLNPVTVSPADWLQCAAQDLPVKYANLRDDRITQLIVANPLTGVLFGEAGLSRVRVPTLVLAGTHDTVTPMASQQLRPFMQLPTDKYLVTVVGGSHLSVGDPNNLNADLGRIPFMAELPDVTTAPLRIFLQGVSFSFIMQQTPGAEDYAPALDSAVAHAFSTTTMSLRLSQTVPEGLAAWPRLRQSGPHRQEGLISYLPSLLHLEALAIQDQVQALQRQMIAYLRHSPPSLTAVYWPFLVPQLPMQANQPGSKPAASQ
ncbi:MULTISPECIES: alpha/beta hydrolase [Cyanophyceae]|uniref:alpha/beta hydrolase n=1 Tax=Cyanophyceae TaxID=3028117 RepID=UPI001684566B|nr:MULTISPECIES: alpha/beta hydrolase [Cyanophyceae]MBD1917796.1 alpha/beta hydrolase [Phormidium sp. FACHB-77]MBD2032914.1 alpha/beta hydrolase [Phormidium sp. FACHB-322]MBD2051662.1 alpha/beta hydrolase [Leptolyngbya sp. FACHB-60]